MTKYRNIARGKLAQSVGEEWEQEIELEARRHGQFLLIKQYPQVRFSGKGRASVVGTAWADYIAMGKMGAFTFDAKSTKHKSKLTLPKKTLHQFLSLQTAQRHGIPAFYLVKWRHTNVVSLHRITEASQWPYVLQIDRADTTTALQPGWFSTISENVLNQKDQ